VHDDNFIQPEGLDSDVDTISQSHASRPASKSRRTKRLALGEDAWRPSDGEASDDDESNLTPRNTRSANQDKYFVAPLPEDSYGNTLPRVTTPKSTKKTSRLSRDITPKRKNTKTNSVSELTNLEAAYISIGGKAPKYPTVTYSAHNSSPPVKQREDATVIGPNTSLGYDIRPRIEVERLTYNMFRDPKTNFVQRDQVEFEDFGNSSGRSDENDTRIASISTIGNHLHEDVFPHGIGPWDRSELSLGMRLSYLDGEFREYELRFEERTIKYIESEGGEELVMSTSPWRELEIPTIAVQYLLHFFEGPDVPGITLTQSESITFTNSGRPL
jgi:hypothetical protein